MKVEMDWGLPEVPASLSKSMSKENRLGGLLAGAQGAEGPRIAASPTLLER